MLGMHEVAEHEGRLDVTPQLKTTSLVVIIDVFKATALFQLKVYHRRLVLFTVPFQQS
jgi:hypothetical protein